MSKPRIAILGAGEISSYHIAGLQDAGARISGIYSHTLGHGRAVAEQWGIPCATNDAFALLARSDVDAVVVATPDWTHCDLTCAALRAGKPVLVQKPMAGNSDECRTMIAVSRENQIPLAVSFMHRHFPEVDAAVALMSTGTIGRVLQVRQRNATAGADWALWLYDPVKNPGGVAMQLGVHGIDLLRYLFGEIETAQALGALSGRPRTLSDGRSEPNQSLDLLTAVYRFTSGSLATHEMGYVPSPGCDRFLTEIYGERGSLALRSSRGPLALQVENEPWQSVAVSSEDVGLRQHRRFLSMLSGAEPWDTTAADALRGIEIIEQMRLPEISRKLAS